MNVFNNPQLPKQPDQPKFIPPSPSQRPPDGGMSDTVIAGLILSGLTVAFLLFPPGYYRFSIPYLLITIFGLIVCVSSFKLSKEKAFLVIAGYTFFAILFPYLFGEIADSYYDNNYRYGYYDRYGLYGLFQIGFYAIQIIFIAPLIIGVIHIISRLNLPLVSWLANYALPFVILMFVLITFFLSFPIIWIMSYILYRRETQMSHRSIIRFRNNAPFLFLGNIVSSQEFAFLRASEHSTKTNNIVRSQLKQYFFIDATDMKIIDVSVSPNYVKDFLNVSYVTKLKTTVNLIFHTMSVGDALFVKWWFLVQGEVKFWDAVRFVVLSPVSFPFWIVPWLRQEFSIMASISGNISHTYDVFDIVGYVTAFQKELFEQILDSLDNEGVDVSEYRQNRPSFNVINVSGSGNILGAVAQGQNAQVHGTVNKQ